MNLLTIQEYPKAYANSVQSKKCCNVVVMYSFDFRKIFKLYRNDILNKTLFVV